jgi:hypothetical protein
MLVTVKTLSNATFKIELNETDTVKIGKKNNCIFNFSLFIKD